MTNLGYLERDLDAVLELYARNNINVGDRPSVAYIHDAPFVARVNNQSKTPRLRDEFIKLFPRSYAERVWNGIGVSLSAPALDEWSLIQARLLERAFTNRGKDFDQDIPTTISVGPAFASKDERFRRWVLAHEVWHVVEDRHAVIGVNHIIAEGTACAVQQLITGIRRRQQEHAWPGWMSIVYNGTSLLVERWLHDKNAPYTALLEPKNRAVIEKDFLETLGAAVEDCFPAIMQDSSYLRDERNITSAHRGFRDVLITSKAKQIDRAYRLFRAHTLADEVARDPAPVERYYAALTKL